MPELRPYGKDVAGNPLYINRRGEVYSARGKTRWRASDDEVRAAWGVDLAADGDDFAEQLADLADALKRSDR